jgi:Tfp pilus assembly protein PilO
MRTAGATISRFEPQPNVNMDTLRQINLAVTSVGSYSEVTKALVALEQLPVALWLEDMEIAPFREDAKKIQLEAKLVVFADNPEISD